MNALKKDRIEFYKQELEYWNNKRNELIENFLNFNDDLELIESKISNYVEWLNKELQDKE